MKELRELFENTLNTSLEQIILSDSRDKEAAQKVKVRPVKIKGELLFQETIYRGTQVFHHNYSKEEMTERILEMLGQADEKQPGIEKPSPIQSGTEQPGTGRPTSERPAVPRFGQAQFTATAMSATVLVSKKGKLTMKVKKQPAGSNSGNSPNGDGKAATTTATCVTKLSLRKTGDVQKILQRHGWHVVCVQ